MIRSGQREDAAFKLFLGFTYAANTAKMWLLDIGSLALEHPTHASSSANVTDL